MPHGTVIERDAGGAQHVATVTRNVERRTDVIPLGERDAGRRRFTALFELRKEPSDQLSAGELANSGGQPRQDELSMAQRTAEQLARLRVTQDRVDAGAGSPASAPRDSEARVV